MHAKRGSEEFKTNRVGVVETEFKYLKQLCYELNVVSL